VHAVLANAELMLLLICCLLVLLLVVLAAAIYAVLLRMNEKRYNMASVNCDHCVRGLAMPFKPAALLRVRTRPPLCMQQSGYNCCKVVAIQELLMHCQR
jgi:hypothetical protein